MRHCQIRLPGLKHRNLQHINGLTGRRHLLNLVRAGDCRHPETFLHFLEDEQALFQPDAQE